MYSLESILDLAHHATGLDETTFTTLFLAGLLEQGHAAEAGSIWLYSPQATELKVSASWGYEPEALRQMRLSPGKSLGRALSTGQPILYPTPTQAAGLIDEMPASQRALYQKGAGVKHPSSAMVAPLRVGDTKLGVLVLENLRNARQFTFDELWRLQSVATLLALALSNLRLTQALGAAQAVNETAQIRKDSIAFLAHEMRTPLTAIKGYATALMMDEVEFNAEDQRGFLENIDQECDTLIRLIEDLLESSVLDAGILELELQPVELARLVKEGVEEIQQTTTRHRFVVEFPSRLPLLEADPVRLAQVMRNLLENAVKYSPQGGLIVLQGKVEPQQVVISVADQGIGIAPEHLNRLFEKYFRVKSGAAKGTIGSGLGLPIARSIVEAHGGQIWAESQVGHGSTFYVALPLAGPAARQDNDGDETDE